MALYAWLNTRLGLRGMILTRDPDGLREKLKKQGILLCEFSGRKLDEIAGKNNN